MSGIINYDRRSAAMTATATATTATAAAATATMTVKSLKLLLRSALSAMRKG